MGLKKSDIVYVYPLFDKTIFWIVYENILPYVK